jgi:hypothetical protein
MGIRGELYSTKIALDNRTYFFNLKENRLGDLYLNIVESKNKDEGGFDRQSIVLFAEDLQNFLKGFDESLQVMEKEMRERKRASKGAPSSRRRAEAPALREDRAERGTETDEESAAPRSERKTAPWDRANRPVRDDRNEDSDDTSERDFTKPEGLPREVNRSEGRAGGFDRPFGDKPRSNKPFGERSIGDRAHGSDRPQGEESYNDRPRSDRPGDDRPQRDRPFGDRPRNDRPHGDRPYGDRPQGDRSHRPSGGFGRSEGPTRDSNDRGYQGRSEGRAPGYPFKREGETAPRTGSQFHGRPAGAPGDASRPDHAGHSGHTGKFGGSPRPFSHAGDDSGFRKKFISGSKKSAGAFGLKKAVRKSRVVRAIPRKDVPED